MAFSDIYTVWTYFSGRKFEHYKAFGRILDDRAGDGILRHRDNMNLAEEFIRYLIGYAMEFNKQRPQIPRSAVDRRRKAKPQAKNELSLLEKLRFVADNQFERITYTETIDILLESPAYKKEKV